MAREGMLGITFRTNKQIFLAGEIAGTALAAEFLLGFVSHLASSSREISLNSNHSYFRDKVPGLKIFVKIRLGSKSDFGPTSS
jgi:hypothetical protein